VVGWVQYIDRVRAHIARRPIMFALAAMLVAGAMLVTTTSPISARNDALTAQIAQRQALYDRLMVNASAVDQAAIELRRMATRDSETPYHRYFAALNDLRWSITPANTPFLDDAGRAQALSQVAALGEAGEDYTHAVRDLRASYGARDTVETVRAAEAAEGAYRALRDRTRSFKAAITASHNAGLAARADAAERARRQEDLIFDGLLLCCLGLLAFFMAARRRAVLLLAETRNGRATLDAVVDGALNGVVMIDEDGVIELFSPSAERIFDCGASQALGASFTRFLDPRVVHRHRSLFKASGRRNPRAVAFQRVVEARRWNGAALPIHLAVSETTIGGARKFVLIVRDMTREVAQSKALEAALEQAQAASRAKTEFLTVMSHELRTPLNGVLGMAAALSSGPLAIPQREMVETILSSGRHLLGLLNDLLDLSSVETGEMSLTPQVFDMETLLGEALGPHADQAAQKGLEFSVNVDPAALGCAFADPRRLRQVIGNLASNAVKFTDRGEVVVYVERPSDTVLRVSISDTGVGFDAATKTRLFADFEQADRSLTRRFGGSGLGLAISRHLVGLMDGTIGCDSRPGEGSRFWFEIKAPVAEPQAAAEGAAPAPPPENLRVLCVDDNPVNRRVIGVLLAPLGADVAYAENGQEAVEAHAHGHFDVILMDLQMPVMDGMAATRAIRAAERQAGRPRTRIVAVSANCMPTQVQDCMAAGMDAHVPKPVMMEVLFAAMIPSQSEGEASEVSVA
jgi:PAS domain S-box-containing protein